MDYAQLVKIYGPAPEEDKRRYSPVECVDTRRKVVSGQPDMVHVSTSYVERSNLTMRMSMRRFTRLTNAFSKKLENHCYVQALYFTYYNFCRPHKSLGGATPAMAAGLAEYPYNTRWIVGQIKAREPVPAPRGPYRKSKISN